MVFPAKETFADTTLELNRLKKLSQNPTPDEIKLMLKVLEKLLAVICACALLIMVTELGSSRSTVVCLQDKLWDVILTP